MGKSSDLCRMQIRPGRLLPELFPLPLVPGSGC